MAIDSKRIAKNTIFLYTRLILVFAVTLYTSRVVLDKLGVEDYGLYNVVISVIGILSFLNGTLSSGTSRFITFELGKKNAERLKLTFSTALFSHVVLAGIVVLLGETLGLWYFYDVMVCPPERLKAAFWVYQFSIVSAALVIFQVPFTAEIMAHERMNIYAYIGIYEAVSKLLICYLLSVTPWDKLVVYGFLMTLVPITVFGFYAFYSYRLFDEVKFKPSYDKGIFQSIMKFSGWNIIANISNMLMRQGVIMLLNAFFAPVVVAAQAVTSQVSNALMQFVENIRQAINPQVIKLYADRKFDESKQLTFVSAEYVFDLLLLIGVPLILIMPNLLHVWLVEVPQYAVEFIRLILVQDILGNFSAAFYTPMVAANKIQRNSIAAAFLCIVQFGMLFLLFKLGFDPMWTRYIGILFVCIWSFVVKPYILWKDIDYKWGEMLICVLRCARNAIIVSALSYAFYVFIPQSNFGYSILVACLSAIVVILTTYLFMPQSIKKKMHGLVAKRLQILK